jgi:hypothetical protein
LILLCLSVFLLHIKFASVLKDVCAIWSINPVG